MQNAHARSFHSDRRKIYLLLVMLLISVMLTSFGRGLDIDRRSLVHAMGIDQGGEGFTLTLQIFSPSGSGADTPVDTSGNNVRLIKSSGATVEEALDYARTQTGQELFFGHLQVICIGRDTDLSAPDKLFAFALSDKSVSPLTPVCTSENSAEEVISVQPDFEETSAEALSEILETGADHCDTAACTLKDIVSSKGENTPLPVLGVRDDEGPRGEGEQSQTKSVYLSSTAVISGGKIADTLLSRDEAMCAAFILGKGRLGSITYINSVPVTANLKRQDTETKVRIIGGRPVFDCKVTLTAGISADINDSDTSPQAARDIESALNNSTERMLQKSASVNADILGVARHIRHTLPDLYLRYENDPMSLCRIADINIRYFVKIE